VTLPRSAVRSEDGWASKVGVVTGRWRDPKRGGETDKDEAPVFLTHERPSWEREGVDWPNAQYSRFVTAAGLRWHVQVLGEGPGLLLLHGTAASAHSWRDHLVPLSNRFRVVIPDLPGHAFTNMPPAYQLTLPGMADAVAELLAVLGVEPMLAVGHSAGAAILIRMALERRIRPVSLISVNGALRPFPGMVGPIFSSLSKLLFLNPFSPRLFAYAARDRSRVVKLIHDTGSRISTRGVDLYARLLRSPGHIAGALGMMAHWDLTNFERDLKALQTPLVLVVGAEDRAIPPSDADRVKALVPAASVVRLPGLGHLAHEEHPEEILQIIMRVARQSGVFVAA